MEKSKLSEYDLIKGKFSTNFSRFFNESGEENPWFQDRLPEYLWLGLIIEHYGRQIGLQKCLNIAKKLPSIDESLFVPAMSIIFDLDEKKQGSVYNIILNEINKAVLSPLTCLFTITFAPIFNKYFFNGNDINLRLEKLNKVITETAFHQTYLSTDVRYIVISQMHFADKLHIMQPEIINKLNRYPNLSHEDEEMRMIRPTIRSTEISLISLDIKNKDYLKKFWEVYSKLTDCDLFCVKFEEGKNNIVEYMKNLKSIMDYFYDLQIENALDNKMLVLFGIANYSYKRILELVEHKLFNTISGRSIIRVLVENLIMIKYLLKNESKHKDIWTEYQYYGIGQFKLIYKRFVELNKDLSKSHVDFNYINALVNEYINDEFIDMDTSYFDKRNIREKASDVAEKELFGLYYDYDSAYEHGLWGAIRESSLLKCNSPSHQYHCVIDINNQQNLKSVWHDCVMVMDKTIEVLKGIFGLPNELLKEKNEK